MNATATTRQTADERRNAAHFTDSMPPGAPALFTDSLSSQEIAGDTLAERAVRDDCVRILTAHRSKGLEWDVVVVAGVQEETWPDLRMRGSLLGVDELAEAASGPGQDASADVDAALLAAKLLAEERRLFYVGMTRAKDRLVLSRALKRLWRGRVHTQAASPFLADIESELVKEQRPDLRRRPEDRQLKLL
jgi:superfamily I DNA/RNA helicase